MKYSIGPNNIIVLKNGGSSSNTNDIVSFRKHYSLGFSSLFVLIIYLFYIKCI